MHDDKTVDYYNRHAQTFFDGTMAVNMAPLYSHFEPLIPKGGRILDAGCGSGRDAGYFVQNGYRVVAFDASSELANLASAFTGLPVSVCYFDEFQNDEPFDGIWACASLLHVSMADLPSVIRHLMGMLTPDGVFYFSCKYGDHDVIRNDRSFTNLDRGRLTTVLSGLDATILEIWLSEDRRPGYESECWFNVILQK